MAIYRAWQIQSLRRAVQQPGGLNQSSDLGNVT